MKYQIKTFSELSTADLFAIYQLRSRVFVVEQSCAYQDVDELDLEALHVMMLDENDLVGYCRIIAPSSPDDSPRIGRVVVDAKFRKKGLGTDLMKFAMAKTLGRFEQAHICISAQTYLKEFYKNLGFIAGGEEYLEDSIPHIKMIYSL